MTEKRMRERFKDYENALARLKEALMQEHDNDIIIDAVIQRFEFTFELAWKLMKDFLEEEGMLELASPKSTIQSGFKSGLIIDGEGWMDILKDRNITSHVYKEETANEIYVRIKEKHVVLMNILYEDIKRRI